MEALAALSFACNVIQLVEFSSKVIIGAEDLYREGSKKENEELKDVTETIRNYSKDLSKRSASDNAELKDIADKAAEVGQELIQLLNSLAVPQDAEHRRWKSVCVILRGMHKSEKMKELDGRLQRLQQVLNTRLLILIRDSNSAITVHITELKKTNEALGAEMADNFGKILQKLTELENRNSNQDTDSPFKQSSGVAESDGNAPEATGILGSLKRYLFRINTNDHPSSNGPSSQKVPPKSSQSNDETLDAVTAKMTATMHCWPDLQKLLLSLSHQASIVAKEQQVLHSLYDKDLMNRYFTVDEEYEDTFRWIFDDPEHGFPQWLESGSGIYWISGIAGSGKSTLMKFIHDHERTKEILGKWAGSTKLLIINHFFWITGAEIQKSYEGLLRSLLFQILRKRPALIPIVCGRRLEGDDFTMQEPWSIRELSECFQCFMEGKVLNDQVCIFVDGLDEYDGNPTDVLKVLKQMAQFSNIKLCVSSRPWTVFEKEFGTKIDKLHMEHLTRNDIQRYIKGRLSEDGNFRILFPADSCKGKEISDIIFRGAGGVFL
ncbi:hypothetical protein GTA08_BOTSDO10490 [Neofusicoccum parvum]|uniref:Uncharacterized protein n=1 Tax=Neofusicoccum parvum TaxID=310453 RepID=A0ACB5RTA8_9PEZI|nr:hypothetical protein GTA08_BOTSDO10490 [Neofusicoccum parvum]